MSRIFTCWVLLAIPTLVSAQATAESYLPVKSQIYFRCDGHAAHADGLARTAWGETLKGDMGVFLSELWKYGKETTLTVVADKEPAYEGLAKDAFAFAESTANHGFALGLEVGPGAPVSAQLVLVFPKAASDTGTLLPLLQKIAEKAGGNLQDQRLGNRIVHTLDIEMVRLGWWREGEDAIVFVGTEDPLQYAKNLVKSEGGVTKNPLYQQLAGFKDFKTTARGFADLKAVFDMVAGFSPEAGKVVDELGLRGLKNMTYVGGYAGAHMRSLMEWEYEGERKGLLALSSDKKLNLADLPSLPAELVALSATSTKMSKVYEVFVDVAKNITKIYAPDQVDNITEGIKGVEALVGINFQNDLFAAFGDVAISYSGRNEGLFSNVVLFQVKDEQKLAKALDAVLKAVPPFPGFELVVRKTPTHGAEILEVLAKNDQVTTAMFSLAVHKGWLVYSAYPQGIKGFVLREAGLLPRWKADAELTTVLKQFPKDFTGIGVMDTRPMMQSVIGLLPLAATIGNTALSQAMPGLKHFPVGSIPHPEEATMRLLPGVTITTDDGKKIRVETRSSMPGPL